MFLAGNQRLIRHANRLAILREVRREPGISRSGLAARTGLTRTAIGRLVDGLCAEGWLCEGPRQVAPGVGRRPTPLTFDGFRRVLLGAHLDGERSRLVATTLGGEVLEFSASPVDGYAGPQALVVLVEQVAALRLRLRAEGRQICGLGVAVPDLVLRHAGLRPPDGAVMPSGPSLRERLGSALRGQGIVDLPVMVERAINCVALHHAETLSAAGGHGAALYLHVGEDVAAAVMHGDALMRGRLGLAGHVAHQTLDVNGPLCSCGRPGCAQALLGLEALRRELGLPRLLSAPALQTELRSRLQAGHELTRAALTGLAGHLGRLLFNLARVHAPDVIHVGGAIFVPGFDPLEEARRRLEGLYQGEPSPRLQAMRSDAQAVAQGAASVMLREMLEGPACAPA
ncbi:MAG: ROK family transcriptional regulator [Candidatus Dactylopiibacterium sp.]|nr:ROK family transcriptional regulator [Candidatus Dactylopiibacterium sp.]